MKASVFDDFVKWFYIFGSHVDPGIMEKFFTKKFVSLFFIVCWMLDEQALTGKGWCVDSFNPGDCAQ